jgi:hypothetical protein
VAAEERRNRAGNREPCAVWTTRRGGRWRGVDWRGLGRVRAAGGGVAVGHRGGSDAGDDVVVVVPMADAVVRIEALESGARGAGDMIAVAPGACGRRGRRRDERGRDRQEGDDAGHEKVAHP